MILSSDSLLLVIGLVHSGLLVEYCAMFAVHVSVACFEACLMGSGTLTLGPPFGALLMHRTRQPDLSLGIKIMEGTLYVRDGLHMYPPFSSPSVSSNLFFSLWVRLSSPV